MNAGLMGVALLHHCLRAAESDLRAAVGHDAERFARAKRDGLSAQFDHACELALLQQGGVAS